MRIILLIQRPQARGAEIFACHLGNELIKKGHQVLLISLFVGDFKLPFSGEQILFDRNPFHRLWDFGAWFRLSREISRWKPDAVQAMGGDTLKAMVLSKKLFRWKSKSVFYNGSLVSSYIRSSRVKAFNSFLFKQLDFVIAVSSASAKDLEALFQFGINQKVIPVGIIPPKIDPKITAGPYPVLVHIGGFSFEKNHEGLLRIFSKVLEKEPKTRLVLIGDGPLKKSIEEKANSMGLSNSISWKGGVSNPFDLVPPNSFLLLPSLIEGLPAVILESFSVGLPVIAYDVGAVSELILPGSTGWLVDKGNEIAFAETVISCIQQNQNEIQKVRNKAKEFVERDFLLPKIADQYEDFYFRLVYAPGPRFERF